MESRNRFRQLLYPGGPVRQPYLSDASQAGGIDSWESIPGLLKSLLIWALENSIFLGTDLQQIIRTRRGISVGGTEPLFVFLLRSPGIDFQPGGPLRQPYLSYWPDRLHRLRNRFQGSLNVYKYGLCVSNVFEAKTALLPLQKPSYVPVIHLFLP